MRTRGRNPGTDLIMGRDNPWQAIYDPGRKVRHGVSDFVSEQANTLSQYADWLTGGEVGSVAEIAPGQGATVRDGLRKLAIYRDEAGKLHGLSATCTHLGCVVHWNSAERSWDCPCHGSRFGLDGEVLHGPTAKALAKIEPEASQGVPRAPGTADQGRALRRAQAAGR